MLCRCLQEITYLTSPGALNPLPPRPPISVNDPSSPVAEGGPSHEQQSAPAASLDRPRKELPDQTVPSSFAKAEAEEMNGIREESAESSRPPAGGAPESHHMAVEATARPPSSPAPRNLSLPDEGPSQDADDAENRILTAIYRPDSQAAWREELRAANEKARDARRESHLVKPPGEQSRGPDQSDEEQLANLTLNVEEDEAKPDEGIERTWTTRRSLKSHLDIVRAVTFAHGPGIILASGGDDNTVKVWSVETASVMSQRWVLRNPPARD